LSNATQTKVQYCVGPVCGGMGLSEDVRQELLRFFPEDRLEASPCMGLCDMGGAFALAGCSYAGDDLDRLSAILDV